MILEVLKLFQITRMDGNIARKNGHYRFED